MAQYKTGTVTVTNGSAIVTGIGTEFQTNGIAAGHRWARNGDSVTYAIASVDSETQITLNSPYAGLTNASAVYTIGKDVTVFHGYPLLFSGDIETATFISYAFQLIDENMAQSLDGEFVAFNSPTGTLAATSVSGAIRELEDSIAGAGGSLLLAGDVGGQQAFGGTGSGENLTFNSTSHANLGFVLLGGLTGLVYDELNGQIGINESVMMAKFHVRSFDSGATSVHADADELIVESNLNGGLTILSGIGYLGTIAFGDSGDNDIGRIEYNHSDNSMSLIAGTNIGLIVTSLPLVGIGETVPAGKLHVKTTDSTATPNTNADELVIEGSVVSGMSILSGIGGSGYIIFGDSGDNDIGFMRYIHTDNSYHITVNTTEALVISSSQHFGLGEAAPANRLHVKVNDAGITPDISANIVIEDTGINYLQFLNVVADTDAGIIWGDTADGRIGWISYSHSSDEMSIGVNNLTTITIDKFFYVGIGETLPLGKLHVKTSDSGATVHSSADDLVVENAQICGISILSGSGASDYGYLMFGDSVSNSSGQIRYNHNDDAMVFVTSSAIRMTLDLGMVVGSPTDGDKGAGTINATAIYVNGVAVGGGATASSGAWTPTLQDDTRSDAEGQTYVSTSGTYTKIDNMVFFSGRMTVTSLGTLSTGQSAVLAGLPFTAKNDPGAKGGFNITLFTSASLPAITEVYGETDQNTTVVSLKLWDGSATAPTSNLLISEFSASGTIWFHGMYQAV